MSDSQANAAAPNAASAVVETVAETPVQKACRLASVVLEKRGIVRRGPAALAVLFGISTSAVQQWGDEIPRARCVALFALLDGQMPMHEMRREYALMAPSNGASA